MPIEILYVIGSLDRGGAETHLLRILPKLDPSKYKVRILLLSHAGELAPDFEKNDVSLVQPWFGVNTNNRLVRLAKILCAAVQTGTYFLLHRPQIVHFVLPKNYLLAAPIAVLLGLPVRVMSRRSLNNYQEKYPGFVRKLEHWLHQRMQAVSGNSQKVVDQLISQEAVPAQRVHLIYNGFSDIERTLTQREQVRAVLGVSPESLVMIIVANLIPYKGHHDLIAALGMAKMPEDWTLLVVGQDSAHIQGDLERQADENGISGHIKFLGQRRDVSDVLACGDIGLLTSHEEGFSNAILEGMASSLPMIVTDVGGNAEAVLHNETGCVVPPRNPAALAQAIEHLSADQALRQKLGAAGKQRQQEKFSLEACVAAYEALYDQLIEDHLH